MTHPVLVHVEMTVIVSAQSTLLNECRKNGTLSFLNIKRADASVYSAHLISVPK